MISSKVAATFLGSIVLGITVGNIRPANFVPNFELPKANARAAETDYLEQWYEDFWGQSKTDISGNHSYPPSDKNFSTYYPMARDAAQRYGIPTDLFAALIDAESNWNPKAVSSRGAKGLGQFIPKTARRYGLTVQGNIDERLDPEKNLDASARYMRDLLTEFRDDDLAIAAYNAGEEAVRTYRGIPPFMETQRHVAKVREKRLLYRNLESRL